MPEEHPILLEPRYCYQNVTASPNKWLKMALKRLGTKKDILSMPLLWLERKRGRLSCIDISPDTLWSVAIQFASLYH
jgi:hypothetical protein